MKKVSKIATKYKGFTLVELMIVVAIIGILAAIALPSYNDYVIRSRLADAFSSLSSASASAEQYWSNNRTYVSFNTSKSFPQNTTNFSYTLTSSSASAFVITATGSGPVAGFEYTIDQSGAKKTVSVKSGWGTTPTNCWINTKGGCVQ